VKTKIRRLAFTLKRTSTNLYQ